MRKIYSQIALVQLCGIAIKSGCNLLLLAVQICLMQLQTELQAHRAVVCGGLRLAAGAYTVNEVVDLRLERLAPAGKEALLALFHEAVLGELREVVPS